MSSWKPTKLRGKIHVKHGFPFQSEAFSDRGRYVVLTPGNFFEKGGFKRNAEKDKCYSIPFPPEYRLRKGDLIVAMTEQAEGLLGSTALVPEDEKFLHNQRLGLITTNTDEVDLEYLYHLFKTTSVRRQIRLSSTGSKVKHTSPDRIYDVEVALPTRITQTRIARVLSALDAKIEVNNRINAELEGMAKLLYDYWFVQFDFPMTAAQAAALGRPALAGHPYKSSGGKLVPNKTLHRPIPEGWTASSIEACSKLNELVWTDKTAPDSLRYVDLANTKSGSILETTDYAWADAPSRARRRLRAGDAIVGTVRPGNRSYCLVPESEHTLTGSTGFAVLSPIKDSYREFNYLTLTSPTNINRLTTLASGAAYPAVNPDVVASHVIPFPPESLIQDYHRKVKSSFDLVQVNQKQNQELTQLRDWLLPLLMNGQVTVGV